MDKFKTVLNIANKQANLGFGLVALLTAGGEQIFSTVVFQCPCNELNFFYGMVFLLVPALALLLLGFILNKTTWRLLTGVCQRSAKLCRVKTVVAFSTILFQIFTTALVAPSVWISVALLSGNYFECLMTGINATVISRNLCAGIKSSEDQCQKHLHSFPCGKDSSVPQADREDLLLSLRSLSQIMGWLLIASIMLSNMMLTCLLRCTSPVSYMQLKFWRLYAKEENSLMESYTAKHAKQLAERNLKCFFEQKLPESIITPCNKEWDKIASISNFSIKKQYYSTLHQYVENCQETDSRRVRMNSNTSCEGTNNPAVLELICNTPEPL